MLSKYCYLYKYNKLLRKHNCNGYICNIFDYIDEESANGFLYGIQLGWFSEEYLTKLIKQNKKERRRNE